MDTFRRSLAASNLKLSSEYPPGYDGLIDIVHDILASASSRSVVVAKSRATLNSLFPNIPPAPSGSTRPGLLYWFEILFAKPFPAFSSKMNAWVTWWAAQWLMGPCELQDLPDAQVGDGAGQLLLVKRCRYLEKGKCASMCMNSCKLPTQEFFNEDMAVPMRMIPDYKTYECRFEFGIPPTEEDEEEARAVSCFVDCPSNKRSVDSSLSIIRCKTN